MVNNRVKVIYLHVGMLKTATSSIQATMAHNTTILKEKNIYYSTRIAVNHSDFLLPIFLKDMTDFHVERERRLSKDVLRCEYEEKKSILTEELLSVENENLVFSAEGLYVFSHKVLNELQQFLMSIYPCATIKIVLCIRNLSEYLASEYQQFIKTGYCSHWKNSLFEESIYKEKIMYFISIVQFSNLVIYDFDDAKKHTFGPVGYFLENILGLQKYVIAQMAILRDNDSISDAVVNVIHYINVVANSPMTIFSKEQLPYERYLSDTQALWSLKGDKFKLDKEYVKELYEKLAPELQWLRENFNIDYNFENATYTKERYKIAEGFFETVKEAFPKLSRIVRRAFYDWLCEEIKTREADEYKELNQTKIWIEKSYQGLLKISLDALKKQITNEIEACKAFFQYFGIENKQSYQLYYHLHLFLKEMCEHEASQIMLNNFYEKNPHWNEKWEEMNKKKIWDFCKNYYFILSDRSKKLELSLERFKTTFGIEKFSNQVLIKQIYLVLKRSNVNLLYKSFYKRGNY